METTIKAAFLKICLMAMGKNSYYLANNTLVSFFWEKSKVFARFCENLENFVDILKTVKETA